MSESRQSGGETILLVEDDEQVRSFIRTILTNEGYKVLEAKTGGEGLTAAEHHGNEIDLLLSDMLLPELSGFDLAARLLPKFPDMRALFITGYVEGEIVQRAINELGAGFLDKPFQPIALLNRIRETLNQPRHAAIRAE